MVQFELKMKLLSNIYLLFFFFALSGTITLQLLYYKFIKFLSLTHLITLWSMLYVVCECMCMSSVSFPFTCIKLGRFIAPDRAKNRYIVYCFEEKVELLWSLDRCCRHHHLHHAKTIVAHCSRSIKAINTKLGILAHHYKVQL